MKKIVIVGSYNTGLSMTVDRLPRPGETLLGSNYTEGPGGKGSNQAIGVSRLKGEAHIICCVGMDRFGDEAVEIWRREKVNAGHVKRVDCHTGLGFVIVARNGENLITVDPGSNMHLLPEDIGKADELFSSSRVVLTQLEVPLETVVAAAREGRRRGAVVILNPAPARKLSAEQLSLFDVITPNRQEFDEMVGGVGLEQGTRALLNSGVGAVVVTLGEMGAFVADKDDQYRVPAPRVNPVDPTGAGDAFNAALGVALAEGEKLRQAVSFANYAGALTTTKMGAVQAIPTREQLDEFRRNDVLE